MVETSESIALSPILQTGYLYNIGTAVSTDSRGVGLYRSNCDRLRKKKFWLAIYNQTLHKNDSKIQSDRQYRQTTFRLLDSLTCHSIIRVLLFIIAACTGVVFDFGNHACIIFVLGNYITVSYIRFECISISMLAKMIIYETLICFS